MMMKKAIAILLGILLVCCLTAGLADPASLGSVNVNGAFDLVGVIPEGYQITESTWNDVMMITSLRHPDMTKPAIDIIIAFDEQYADVERMNDLSEEELEIIESSYAEYTPEFRYEETSHGTKLLCMTAEGEGAEFLSVVTIYRGYMVEFYLVPGPDSSEKTLTEEQITLAIDFLSDLDFIPVNAQ